MIINNELAISNVQGTLNYVKTGIKGSDVARSFLKVVQSKFLRFYLSVA